MFSLSLVVTADGCRSGGATCCVIRMIICVNLTAFNERSQHMCANQSERLIFYIFPHFAMPSWRLLHFFLLVQPIWAVFQSRRMREKCDSLSFVRFRFIECNFYDSIKKVNGIERERYEWLKFYWSGAEASEGALKSPLCASVRDRAGPGVLEGKKNRQRSFSLSPCAGDVPEISASRRQLSHCWKFGVDKGCTRKKGENRNTNAAPTAASKKLPTTLIFFFPASPFRLGRSVLAIIHISMTRFPSPLSPCGKASVCRLRNESQL